MTHKSILAQLLLIQKAQNGVRYAEARDLTEALIREMRRAITQGESQQPRQCPLLETVTL